MSRDPSQIPGSTINICMKNYRLLDIKIPPLKEGFELPKGDRPQSFYSLKVEDVFNQDIIDFFLGIGFVPQYALIFHHQPFVNYQNIHTDNVGDTFRCSINWAFCKEQAMRWYVPKEGSKIVSHTTSPLYGENNAKDVPFKILPLEDAVLIEETRDKGPMLVSVGNVFHNAVNLGDTDRWSVIMKFTMKSTPTWDHCLNALQPWLINERK